MSRDDLKDVITSLDPMIPSENRTELQEMVLDIRANAYMANLRRQRRVRSDMEIVIDNMFLGVAEA